MTMSAFDLRLVRDPIRSDRMSRVGGTECSTPPDVSLMQDTRRAGHAVDRRFQRCNDLRAAEARREAELDYRVSPALGWCGPMALVGARRRAAVAPNEVATPVVSVPGRWPRAVQRIGSWRRSLLGSREPAPDGQARVRRRVRTVAAPTRGQG